MTFQMESYATLTRLHAGSIEYFKDISFSLAHFFTSLCHGKFGFIFLWSMQQILYIV